MLVANSPKKPAHTLTNRRRGSSSYTRIHRYTCTLWRVQVIAWSSALFRGNCVASPAERHAAQRGPILHGVNRIIPPWPPIENSNAAVSWAAPLAAFVSSRGRDGRVHPHPNAIRVREIRTTRANEIDIRRCEDPIHSD